MPMRLALILAAMVVAFVIADAALNAGEASLFLVRKFVALVDYLSFWR